MAIVLKNTATRTKEEFTPLSPGIVRIYSCGPTVYNYAHIGNLRAYVFADLLRRMFEFNGYEVKQVVNITDVGHLTSDEDEGEDKIEKGAAREGKSVEEIIEYYSNAFFHDTKELNIEPAMVYPRASKHIDEQIELIRALESRDFTYQTSDGIYFDTSKFARYGDFAKLDTEGLRAGARVEANLEKRNPTDFALWKFSKEGEKRQQEWESPWGIGFPGWHLECSAMAMLYLDTTIDIHTGGIDHIPVHHTNEIAQSECATGVTFANYWMHSGHITVDGEKMSKSIGNILLLSDLEEHGIDPLAYRYWLLTAHYNKTVNFTWDAIEGAQKALVKLFDFFLGLPDESAPVDEEYIERFRSYINDDIDTPKGIALLWELLRDTHVSPASKRATMLAFDHVLGLDLAHATHEEIEMSDDLKQIIDQREEARKHKDWEFSDTLREKARDLGYEILDTPEGPKVRRAE